MSEPALAEVVENVELVGVPHVGTRPRVHSRDKEALIGVHLHNLPVGAARQPIADEGACQGPHGFQHMRVHARSVPRLDFEED